jgi:alpha-glucuronidase
MDLALRRFIYAVLAVSPVVSAAPARGETGIDAWLRYERIADPAVRAADAQLPETIVAIGDGRVVQTARDEIVRGVGSMLDRRVTPAPRIQDGAAAIVLGTAGDLRRAVPDAAVPADLRADGFWVGSVRRRGASQPSIVVAGATERGVLYGAFALLRRVALQQPLTGAAERNEPAAPLRWVNEWNNLDGSIERGYAGRSIFFAGDRVVSDLTRAGQYARLLASVGINACAVNNVNANVRVITDAFIPDLVRLAEAFRPWGVGLAVAIDFSSPQRIGGLDTFDPLDERVAGFWKARVEALYRAIPDLAGFVLKADSEGRLGPSAYGRSHADAANVIARALAPHHGVLFYRGFVYDHHLDWRNPKNDRARAADDNFRALDGRFDDNVVLQIKHGPIDFQVREPASPLFGTLSKTNQAIELQITQEYTGQQRHVCFLVPMWKEALDFDLAVKPGGTRVRDLVAGRTAGRPLGGFVGVSNVGLDANWLGHDLAQANLYGFARLAWQPALSAGQIADEWTRLTFGHDRRVVEAVTGILLDSWPAYERYTGPLGAGTLTDIIGVHYGPGVESSERNGWGQWHRADHDGVGMDRTVATGTGYIGQYAPRVASIYESLATCPDELLLFMHHVPYTHVLRSGKTVIQHIYDSHYDGAAQAAAFVERWRTLETLIDRERYAAVLDRLDYQAGHAIVWRDAVTTWFARESGIADAQARVGRAPGRVEAEAMSLDGYAAVAVTPWETASGGQAVACARATCSAAHTFTGTAGRYDIAAEYFDESDGASAFALAVGGREIDRWVANADFPSPEPNGHTATRHVVRGVALAPGDIVRVEARPDRGESAVIDYVEIVASNRR